MKLLGIFVYLLFVIGCGSQSKKEMITSFDVMSFNVDGLYDAVDDRMDRMDDIYLPKWQKVDSVFKRTCRIRSRAGSLA